MPHNHGNAIQWAAQLHIQGLTPSRVCEAPPPPRAWGKHGLDTTVGTLNAAPHYQTHVLTVWYLAYGTNGKLESLESRADRRR